MHIFSQFLPYSPVKYRTVSCHTPLFLYFTPSKAFCDVTLNNYTKKIAKPHTGQIFAILGMMIYVSIVLYLKLSLRHLSNLGRCFFLCDTHLFKKTFFEGMPKSKVAPLFLFRSLCGILGYHNRYTRHV